MTKLQIAKRAGLDFFYAVRNLPRNQIRGKMFVMSVMDYSGIRHITCEWPDRALRKKAKP